MVHDSCVMNVMLGSFTQQNGTLYMWKKPNHLTSINILLSVRSLFLMSNISLPLKKSTDSCGVYYHRVFIVFCMLNNYSKTLHGYFFNCLLLIWICVLVDNCLSSVNNFHIIALKSKLSWSVFSEHFSSYSHYI